MKIERGATPLFACNLQPWYLKKKTHEIKDFKMALSQVLVTVGTTNFDDLIDKTQSDEVLQILKSKGCKKLIIQFGNGKIEPQVEHSDDFTVDSYDYKSSLADDIKSSDLVISHAGAGTSLEVLEAGKLLVTVVNESLMDNHQLELAKKFYEQGYSLYCVPNDLPVTLKSLTPTKIKQLKPFPPSSTYKFNDYLENVLGFSQIK
uniref:UDP-N-acetylglucosamine transferase subunit ALG13 n=1 Tax=Cacopsylla melanoneura TaxID=428564 RepID=A0A8D8YJ68_9HEMI